MRLFLLQIVVIDDKVTHYCIAFFFAIAVVDNEKTLGLVVACVRLDRALPHRANTLEIF